MKHPPFNTDYIRDMKLCPLCRGHILIDTDLSNAFGLGLNAGENDKNPYNHMTDYAKFVNFRIGRQSQARDNLEQAFKRAFGE